MKKIWYVIERTAINPVTFHYVMDVDCVRECNNANGIELYPNEIAYKCNEQVTVHPFATKKDATDFYNEKKISSNGYFTCYGEFANEICQHWSIEPINNNDEFRFKEARMLYIGNVNLAYTDILVDITYDPSLKTVYISNNIPKNEQEKMPEQDKIWFEILRDYAIRFVTDEWVPGKIKPDDVEVQEQNETKTI